MLHYSSDTETLVLVCAALTMKTKRTKGSSPRVTAGTKIRRPQLFRVELGTPLPWPTIFLVTSCFWYLLFNRFATLTIKPGLWPLWPVSDGAQKATGDSRHDLQDELPFGPSRIVPELHKLKLFEYQTPFNLLLPSFSSLKPLVRSQKCGEWYIWQKVHAGDKPFCC